MALSWPFLTPVLTHFLNLANPLHSIAWNQAGKTLRHIHAIARLSVTCCCRSCVSTLPIPLTTGPRGPSKTTSSPWSSSHRGRPSPPGNDSRLRPRPCSVTTSMFTPGTSGRTMVRELEKRGVSSHPKAWLQRLVHFRVPCRDRNESPFALSGCARRALWGALGLWPPWRRASTTGPWLWTAARCKAV